MRRLKHHETLGLLRQWYIQTSYNNNATMSFQLIMPRFMKWDHPSNKLTKTILSLHLSLFFDMNVHLCRSWKQRILFKLTKRGLLITSPLDLDQSFWRQSSNHGWGVACHLNVLWALCFFQMLTPPLFVVKLPHL